MQNVGPFGPQYMLSDRWELPQVSSLLCLAINIGLAGRFSDILTDLPRRKRLQPEGLAE
ncbi:MAG: hypothetical protein ACK57P_08825 [Planctomycetota bacterium]